MRPSLLRRLKAFLCSHYCAECGHALDSKGFCLEDALSEASCTCLELRHFEVLRFVPGLRRKKRSSS